VTGFDKSQLSHTQSQGWIFISTQFLHQWTNNLCVCNCHCFPGLLLLRLVSKACLDMLECLGGLQMAVVWIDKHPPSWKLPHDWPESLVIKLATICDILSSNGPQVRLSSSVNFNMWKDLPLPWLPTTPDLHLYMIICDSGIKNI